MCLKTERFSNSKYDTHRFVDSKTFKLDLGSEIDTSNLQQPLVAFFQPWPQIHVHENRGIEDLAA